MKPRLKLHLDGKISVVRAAASGWNAYAAKDFLRQHYGSVGAAAAALHVPSWALHQALHEHLGARHSAGHVGQCRQLLGLFSQPTQRALAAARRTAKARRAAA